MKAMLTLEQTNSCYIPISTKPVILTGVIFSWQNIKIQRNVLKKIKYILFLYCKYMIYTSIYIKCSTISCFYLGLVIISSPQFLHKDIFFNVHLHFHSKYIFPYYNKNIHNLLTFQATITVN